MICVSEVLKMRLEQEKLVLTREQDESRSAYQKLLRDFHELETRSETMEKELARYSFRPWMFSEYELSMKVNGRTVSCFVSEYTGKMEKFLLPSVLNTIIVLLQVPAHWVLKMTAWATLLNYLMTQARYAFRWFCAMCLLRRLTNGDSKSVVSPSVSYPPHAE